jgi:asparagine synthase (glutamine-hydrolysing)
VLTQARLDNGPELARLLETADEPAALILAAYRRWGSSCPRHLLGDFAFAIWDGERRTLFCARDPLGVQPLHWHRTGPRLWLASEARQLLTDPAVPADLDEQTVADYLAGLPEDPSRTFFRSIQPVPPGHTLTAEAAGQRLERFWKPGEGREIRYRRREEYAEHLRELLQTAVATRLPGPEAPVAVTLSGGLDSGSVAALAVQVRSVQCGTRPFAVSMVFDQLRECDEREWILPAAAELGIEVVTVPAERFQFLSNPEIDRPALDTPFLAWDSCFHEVLRKARQRGAGVVLTGHGGDELLGGSPRVYADRLRHGDLTAAWEIARYAKRSGSERWKVLSYYLTQPLAPRLDRGFRRLLGKRILPPPRLPAWIPGDFVKRSGLEERWAEAISPERFRRPAREDILESLGSMAGDRALLWYARRAAVFGFEVRHPFLDRRLVEFSAAIPPQQLFQVGHYKPLLRHALKGLLPEPVRLRRDKTRLSGFVDLSLRNSFARLETSLERPLAAELGFLNGASFRAAFRKYLQDKSEKPSTVLWYAFTLEIWFREYTTQLGFAA